jgi:hypothetical protein
MEITRIYLVENCYGDPNKVYIGKTKTNYRKYKHVQTFGKDIIFTYIDEINSLNKNDWEPLESFWIEYFRQLGFEMVNKNRGGGGSNIVSQETRDKMKLAKQNISQETRYKMSLSAKNKIYSQESREKMSKSKLGIKKPLGTGDKISKTKKGVKYSQNHKNKMRLSHLKAVLQYDLKGNFIKEWDGVIIASEQTGIHASNIAGCCRGIYKTSGKFIWKYK